MPDADVAGAMRVRVSLSPALRERIDRVTDVLGVPDSQVITLALAMGLRMLDMTLVNPISPGINQAMDDRVNSELRGAVAEGGAKLR